MLDEAKVIKEYQAGRAKGRSNASVLRSLVVNHMATEKRLRGILRRAGVFLPEDQNLDATAVWDRYRQANPADHAGERLVVAAIATEFSTSNEAIEEIVRDPSRPRTFNEDAYATKRFLEREAHIDAGDQQDRSARKAMVLALVALAIGVTALFVFFSEPERDKSYGDLQREKIEHGAKDLCDTVGGCKN